MREFLSLDNKLILFQRTTRCGDIERAGRRFRNPPREVSGGDGPTRSQGRQREGVHQKSKGDCWIWTQRWQANNALIVRGRRETIGSAPDNAQSVRIRHTGSWTERAERAEKEQGNEKVRLAEFVDFWESPPDLQQRRRVASPADRTTHRSQDPRPFTAGTVACLSPPRAPILPSSLSTRAFIS